MGEIRFVGTGETRGYPYLVCKKEKSQTPVDRDILVQWVTNVHLNNITDMMKC